jgi:ElaB/YqjD/DUF883 family membrane-anchored ribosome-binding protein
MKDATETIDKLYDKAEEKVEEAGRGARARLRGGVRQAEYMIEDLVDYVARNPLTSVAWAVAAGVAAGIGLAKLTAPSTQHPFLERVREGVEAGEKSWRQIRDGFGQVVSGLKAAADRN